MLVIIENRKDNNLSFLHLADQDKWEEKLPFIIFVHGFTSAKEHNLHYAYLLAEKGFRVILPDTLYHGEREMGFSGHDLNLRFWEIVLQTIDELDVLKDIFEKEQLIDSSRIGLVGTSMGGIITLGALTKYSWIKAAVSLMGMPYYEKFALYQIDELQKHNIEIPFQDEELSQLLETLRELDLSIQPEKLENRPLLFWHGMQDKTVPYSYTYQFYESIKSLYREEPQKLRFISDEKSGHKVSREGVLNTVKWFEEYI